MYSRRCLKTIETCNLLGKYFAEITFIPTEQRSSKNVKLRFHELVFNIFTDIGEMLKFESEA